MAFFRANVMRIRISYLNSVDSKTAISAKPVYRGSVYDELVQPVQPSLIVVWTIQLRRHRHLGPISCPWSKV